MGRTFCAVSVYAMVPPGTAVGLAATLVNEIGFTSAVVADELGGCKLDELAEAVAVTCVAVAVPTTVAERVMVSVCPELNGLSGKARRAFKLSGLANDAPATPETLDPANENESEFTSGFGIETCSELAVVDEVVTVMVYVNWSPR